MNVGWWAGALDPSRGIGLEGVGIWPGVSVLRVRVGNWGGWRVLSGVELGEVEGVVGVCQRPLCGQDCSVGSRSAGGPPRKNAGIRIAAR